MDILYKAVLKFPRDESSTKKAEEFAKSFLKSRDTTTWYFNFKDKTELNAAVSFVQGTPLKLPYHYQFNLSIAEIEKFPGFGFQVDAFDDLFAGGKVNSKKMKSKSLAADFKTNDIFANETGIQSLNSGAKEISWRDFQGSDGAIYHRLTVRKEMLDPMIIPRPIEISESAYQRGYFHVVTDGLSVITERSAKQLEEHGLLIPSPLKPRGRYTRGSP